MIVIMDEVVIRPGRGVADMSVEFDLGDTPGAERVERCKAVVTDRRRYGRDHG